MRMLLMINNYKNKLKDEINNYKAVENVHDLPASFSYIGTNYLKKLLKEKLDIESFDELILNHINLIKSSKKEQDIQILSLGSGNCDFEINFINKNNLKTHITCCEINPHMIKRAKKNAVEKEIDVKITCLECDINKLRLDRTYDIILANHSLHHFVELEHIFNEVNNAMTDNSFFIISDMIGRNGHMYWDNTFDVCNRIWDTLPKEFKYNHLLKKYYKNRIQWDCSLDGFEGIRAQDILPLLDKNFQFKDFGTFFSLINTFTNRDFGHNFDADNHFHRSILDMLWYYDDYFLRNKALKPTQIIASLVKKGVNINNFKYTYFSDAKDIYTMDDNLIYEFIDKPSRKNKFNIVQKISNSLSNQKRIFRSFIISILPVQLVDFLRKLKNKK